MSLKDVVNISITRGTKSVSQMGFGTPMILGVHKAFVERSRYYSDLDGIAQDFEATDKVYIAAQSLFSQSPTVVGVRIGRKQAATQNINILVAAPSTVYSIKFTTTAGTANISYTSASTTTINAIVDGLVAAVNDSSLTIEAVEASVGVITISEETDLPFANSFISNTSAGVTTMSFVALSDNDETYVEALQVIKDIIDDWYSYAITSHEQTKVLAVAAWNETQAKLFWTSSNDEDTLSASSEDSTAFKLHALAYDRTIILFTEEADTVFPECGMMVRLLTTIAGSSTVAFKDIVGLVVSNITPDSELNAHNMKANTFQEIAGVRIIRDGVVVSGEYIDVMYFCDWLQARMAETIYTAMVSLPKIPFTDSGIAVVDGAMKKVLSIGVQNGGLSDDPTPTTSVPLAKDVPTADKAARSLGSAEAPVTFEGTLAGAIQKVSVFGTITL